MTHDVKKERYDGLLWGTTITQSVGTHGSPVIILIPFEVKISLSGVGTNLEGTYELSTTPRIISPYAPMPYPGPLDIFTPGSYPAQFTRLDGTPSMVLSSTFEVVPVMHKGSVKATVKRTKMSIELLGIPESTRIMCTAIVDRSATMGSVYQGMCLPVFATGEVDLGFFSSKSAIHMATFELEFSPKAIAYVSEFKLEKERKGTFPIGGIHRGNAEFVVVKVESFYSVIEEGGEKYVEQTGLEDARKLFLEHPELLAKFQSEAKRQIRHGIEDEHVSKGLVDSVLRSKDSATSGSSTEAAGTMSASGIEGRDLDKIFLEALKTLVDYGGSSNHAMVVSCGWAKFLRIEKGKKLQLDVAGSMYVQNICKLKESHIDILKEMGLLLDSHSVEIYTRKFDATSEDELAEAARLIQPIFSKVYRRAKGQEAYLEMILDVKTTEAVAALDKLATQFPHRDGNKLRFRW